MMSCARFGQFEASVEELSISWEEMTINLEMLNGEAIKEQTNLNKLADQIPLKTISAFRFGENYLEPSDQLVSKFIGHKSTFDEMVEDIRLFTKQCETRAQSLSAIQQQFSEGQLPVNIQDEIRMLNGFLNDNQKKITDWRDQIKVVAGQCQKTGETIIELND